MIEITNILDYKSYINKDKIRRIINRGLITYVDVYTEFTKESKDYDLFPKSILNKLFSYYTYAKQIKSHSGKYTIEGIFGLFGFISIVGVRNYTTKNICTVSKIIEILEDLPEIKDHTYYETGMKILTHKSSLIKDSMLVTGTRFKEYSEKFKKIND